ncbi:rhodanese-like domain-containing protein [Verrucomicrobium spinosum]|uniref:rhodanese-like domain-containing protein n=1 Tax=Verrucomicrobium spinosum TaxID=2736 RepID=UPI0001746B45|nr:rhodanese-like domain-containing protein [Verrucomicrobium spinosum]
MDTDISPEELDQLMKQDGPRPFRLIDVREEDEFHICKLESAELIPLSRFMESAPVRLVDKDKPIVVYCHHGMRSARAAAALRHMGYKEVYNLTGGIEVWAVRIDPTMRRY